MEDVELVKATQEAGASAFSAVFDRHAASVYDLALAMLGDPRAAQEVVVATFHDALLRLDGLADERRLAVWLLAIARYEAALVAPATVAEGHRPLVPDDDPGRAELTSLVWEAVGELPLLERAHLDLKLRHGMVGANLADALGVTIRHAQDLEDRLRGIKKDLSVFLVARMARTSCPDLAGLLKDWDHRFTSPGLRPLASHVGECPSCTPASSSLPSPFALYAAVPMAPCPPAARDRALHPPAVPDPAGGDHGHPAAEPSPASSPPDSKLLASIAFQRVAPPPSRRPPPASPTGSADTQPKLLLKLLPEPSPPSDADPATGAARRAVPQAAPRPVSPHSPSVALDPLQAPGPPGDVGPERRLLPWLPDGFPPPSFPSPQGTSTSYPPVGPRRSSRRWLPVAATLGAALLLGGVLLVAGGDDDRTALRSGPTFTSTTAEPTTLPPATLAPLVPEQPTVIPTPTSSTAATTAATTAPAAPTTPAPPVAGGGELFSALATLGLPTVDSTAGTRTAALPLRNRGRAPLAYSTRSSFAGLTVDRPTGTIPPGATVQLNVTLDGTRASEGNFTATLTFDGTGGTQQVTVTAVVGRPPIIRDDAGESCTTGTVPCSRLLQLVPAAGGEPNPTLCNTPWRYSVTVEDESRLRAVTADADIAGRDAALKKDGATTGTGGRWQSAVFPPLPAGAVLTVTINAVDEFDFGRFRTDSRIEC